MTDREVCAIIVIRHLAWCCYQMGAKQEYNKDINLDQMRSLEDGVKYQLEHPDCTPEENHNNWMKMKISQGWKRGLVKDFEKKEHPDLVPYSELPGVEKCKDGMDMFAHQEALGVIKILKEGL